MSDPADPVTRAFIDALHRLEQSGDVEPMVAQFAADAELVNLARHDAGNDGARTFWQRYRQQFGEIESRFSRIIETGSDAVLVWRSRGSLSQGRPIDYRGVSLLSLRDGKVARFETVYDSAAFQQPQGASVEAA